MAGRIVASGGFGGVGLEHASESLRARIAAADADYERQAAKEAREREFLVEQRREADIRASVELAEARGELLTMRERMHGVGRTRAEAVSFYSAQADVEDARREADMARRFRAWELHQSEMNSADMTPPSEADISELATMQSRAAEFRSKVADELRVRAAAVAEARRLANVDRRAVDRRRWGV